MITHECAHVSARDNVKRLLIRACPDPFGTPRHLDRAWAAAAEEAADAAAARIRPSARLDLAQALIHVARLAVPRTPELVSAFYLGGSIDARVRLLVDPPADVAPPRWRRFAVPALALLAAAAVVAAAPAVYALLEIAIRNLP
jgi:beta-lactamase regulating signal transducer with metallopeptidase domain